LLVQPKTVKFKGFNIYRDFVAFHLTPATGSSFVGRKELVSELVTELSSKNKIGYSLSGARRIGKTSILREVERQLKTDHGIPVIYLSVWRVSPATVDQFVRVLDLATVSTFEDSLPAKFKFEELLSAGATALGRLLQNLKLSAGVGKDLEVSVSYVRGEATDVSDALAKSFSLAEDMAKMVGKPCVLMLDEFPSLTDLTYGSKNQKIGESIIKLARTLYEEFEHTKLVISGSYRGTLENVVMKQRAPFYRQLLLREVKPFDGAEYGEFLAHYLPSLRFGGDARAQLYRATSGIPYSLQLLAREIDYDKVGELDGRKLHDITRKLLGDEGELLFREYVEGLSPSEVKVLRALAKHPKGRPRELADEQFMDGNSVTSSLTVLQRKGLIQREGRASYGFVDNLFAEWLKMP
jgi:AAA+ ATPase superfamily predicted ATPase